jgi:hypothetical protein
MVLNVLRSRQDRFHLKRKERKTLLIHGNLSGGQTGVAVGKRNAIRSEWSDRRSYYTGKSLKFPGAKDGDIHFIEAAGCRCQTSRIRPGTCQR